MSVTGFAMVWFWARNRTTVRKATRHAGLRGNAAFVDTIRCGREPRPVATNPYEFMETPLAVYNSGIVLSVNLI